MTDTRTRALEREMTDIATGESRSVIIHEPIVPKRRGEDPGIRADEQFVMVFPEHFVELGMTGQEQQVLILIAGQANPHTGRASYSTGEIARQLGIQSSRVSQLVANLDDRGALVRESRGIVTINPLVVWRGEIKKRRELLRGTK